MRSFSHYGTRIATVDAVVLVGDVQTRDRANVHSSRYGVATVQRLIAVVLVGDVQMLHQNHNRRLLVGFASVHADGAGMSHHHCPTSNTTWYKHVENDCHSAIGFILVLLHGNLAGLHVGCRTYTTFVQHH